MLLLVFLLFSPKIYSLPLRDGNSLEETSTTLPTQPQCLGCMYQQKCYPPGADISKGDDGVNWCYGLYCSHSGGVVAWDNWKCGLSTTVSPTPTTMPLTTAPSSNPSTTTGCWQNGVWYPPGEEISQGICCDSHGQVAVQCEPFSNTPSTKEPLTTAPALPGCQYFGKWYPPGTIYEDSYGHGWCFGAICSPDGEVIFWDDFNCIPTTTPFQTTIPTTIPITIPATTPKTHPQM